MLDTDEKRLVYDRMKSRARSILSRLKSCEKYTAAARSTMAGIPDENRMRDWVISVRWAVKRCGLVGATILVYHLTRQQHSQANSFQTIGRELGMPSVEAQLIFDLSLATFLKQLDDRKIPDDYKDWIELAA